MKIKCIRIEVRPFTELGEHGKGLFKMEIWIDDKWYTSQMVEPEDHFISVFDFISSKAIREIKGMIQEECKLTTSK